MQHAKENTKQILDINSKTAKTFEQNSRELTKAAQDSASRFNASINNNNSGRSNTGSSSTTTTSTTSQLNLKKTELFFIKKVEVSSKLLFKKLSNNHRFITIVC